MSGIIVLEKLEAFRCQLKFGVFCNHMCTLSSCRPFSAVAWSQIRHDGGFSRAHNPDTAENSAMLDIQQLLSVKGFSFADYHLPTPLPSNQLPVTVSDQAEQQIQGAEQMAQLNDKQREAVDIIVHAVDDYTQTSSPTKGHCFFIDDPGGKGEYELCIGWPTFILELALCNVLVHFLIGKTFVCNTLTSVFRGTNQKAATAAWTGIAAQLLSGGRTLHSLFKLPVPILDTSICNVSPTTPHAAMLRDLCLIIVDEASMIPAHALPGFNQVGGGGGGGGGSFPPKNFGILQPLK